MTRGCLAGTAVCFISNEGDVYPCGYMPVSAGSTRERRSSVTIKARSLFAFT
jgi:MoaA/NifB/PqqE/SkfB family radical SAM enzyme